MVDDQEGPVSVLKPNLLETVQKNYDDMIETFRELQNNLNSFVARILMAEFQLTNVRAETNDLENQNRDLEQNLRNMKEKYQKNDGVVTELRKEVTSLRGQVADFHRRAQELSISLALVQHELNMLRMQARPPSYFLGLKQNDEKKKSSQPQEEECSQGAKKRLKSARDSQKKKPDSGTHDTGPGDTSVEEEQEEAGTVTREEGVNGLQQDTKAVSVSGPSSSMEPHNEYQGNSATEKEAKPAQEVDTFLPEGPVSEVISEPVPEAFSPESPTPSAVELLQNLQLPAKIPRRSIHPQQPGDA